MKFVLLNAIANIFLIFRFSTVVLFILGLVWVFSKYYYYSFEIVLLKVILFECYCEIFSYFQIQSIRLKMTGLVEIFLKTLLINRHWIYVIP